MGQRRLRQQLQRFVIIDVVIAENAAMAVGGVLAHAHIGDDVHFWMQHLCPHDRPLDDAVRGVGLAAHRVLVRRDAEQHDAADPRLRQAVQYLAHAIHGIAILAGHGGDLLHLVLAVHDEHRVDQGGLVHPRLPDHFAKGLAAPQPPGPYDHIHIHTLL